MQIWAESGKSALPICNYSQILYQFLTFTQNLKRSLIERWFRSFKYEEAYLTQYNNIKEARAAIGQYIHTYNFERRHSALDYQTPAECYYPAMLLPYVA